MKFLVKMEVTMFFCAVFFCADIYSETKIIPSAGVSVDVAVGTEWLYSAVAAVPVIIVDESIGISAAPSFYFRNTEYLLMLPVCLVVPVKVFDFSGLFYFTGGAGPGYHHDDGRGELLPVLQGGVGLVYQNFSI